MKLSVYVPEDLAERLRVVKDDLNVSEVCQAALSQAVSAAEVARIGDLRPRIVERLKRTQTPEEQEFDRGLSSGRRWAADAATLTDLKAVACSPPTDLTLGGALTRVQHWLSNPSVTGKPANSFAALLDRYAAEAKTKKLNYLQGFRQGAREVWDSVRSEFET